MSVLTAVLALCVMCVLCPHTNEHSHTVQHLCTPTSTSRSPSPPHLCRNILKRLSHITGLHFTGNSRYLMCACSAFMSVFFYFILAGRTVVGWTTNCLNLSGAKKHTFSTVCSIMALIVYSSEKEKNWGGAEKIKRQGEKRLRGGQMKRRVQKRTKNRVTEKG